MSRVVMTDHARQRLFERRAIVMTNETERAICYFVELELMLYPIEAQRGRIDVRIPMITGMGDIVARTVNYSIVTIMTGARQNTKRIINEQRRAQTPSGKTTRAERIILDRRRQKYMKRWEQE